MILDVKFFPAVEGRAYAQIFDFEFLFGRGDGLMRNPDKNAGRGNKGDHNYDMYTDDLHCQH